MASDPVLRSCVISDVIGALERVNQAIAKAEGSEDMLRRVLDEMLDIFDCDRAWLLYPVTIDTESYRIPMERTRPEWPGAGIGQMSVPMDDFSRSLFAHTLEHGTPVSVGPDHFTLGQDPEVFKRFGIRSMLLMPIQPKDDAPWLLGIHHCAEPRNYGGAIALFRAIGGRIADGLSTHVAIGRLRASEARFRTLVEHAPEAIVILDCDLGVFTAANVRACELFGVSRQALLNNVGFAEFSPERQPDGRTSFDAGNAFIQQALGGEELAFEWMHIQGSGAEIPCEVRLVALPDTDRNLVRGSLTNIAVRKQAERERAEMLERLAQSQRLEAIGQLTGGIAHDFNNLLTVVLGNLELAVARGVPVAARDSIEAASSAATRAASLIRRLLAFSRQQPLRPAALDVGDLLGGMENMMSRTLGEQVRVELVIPPSLWACEADATQLESAILNLVINARDAMPSGGSIRLEPANVDVQEGQFGPGIEVSAGQYVAISVIDDGEGMSEDILAKIFAPFFTTKDVGRGSGLGLPMVYGFVRQSGGYVDVRSEPGEGTTMCLFLPRATAHTPDFVEAIPRADAPVGKGELILVVEDDEAVRTLTLRLLDKMGYRVVVASAAAEALTVLEQHPAIQLLLSDVVLPGGTNGVQLAEAACERRPGLAVLLMSGYSRNAITGAGSLGSRVTLLEKPFSRQALAIHVRQILDAGQDRTAD